MAETSGDIRFTCSSSEAVLVAELLDALHRNPAVEEQLRTLFHYLKTGSVFDPEKLLAGAKARKGDPRHV